jgi:MYND finger
MTSNENSSTVSVTNLVNPLEKKQPTFQWLQTFELGYVMGDSKKKSVGNKTTNNSSQSSTTVVCFHCGKDPMMADNINTKKLSTCSKCHVAAYCSRDCQVNDWKAGGHKSECSTYSRVASHIQAVRQYDRQQQQQQQQQHQHVEKKKEDENSNKDESNDRGKTLKPELEETAADAADTDQSSSTSRPPPLSPPKLNEDVQTTLRNELFGRMRFYACPYAVFKNSQLGRGFLFLQSDRTLLDLSYMTPKDGITGQSFADDRNSTGTSSQNRAILIHYLTLGEFDAELCREDFEYYHIRTQLQNAIDTYIPDKQLVLLCRFRDGHMAVGIVALVPDYGICQKLGQDYYSGNDTGALQLNLDDL